LLILFGDIIIIFAVSQKTIYFHRKIWRKRDINIFTLPHEINPIALYNQDVIYKMRFDSTAETLQEFGKNELHGIHNISKKEIEIIGKMSKYH